MPTSGPRETKPPSDGFVNPKSSTAVLPCLLSLDTVCNPTLCSHGLRPSLVPHIHRLIFPQRHNGTPCLSGPSGKSLLLSPCSNFGTSVVVAESFLTTPRGDSLESTHRSNHSVMPSTRSSIFMVSISRDLILLKQPNACLPSPFTHSSPVILSLSRSIWLQQEYVCGNQGEAFDCRAQ